MQMYKSKKILLVSNSSWNIYNFRLNLIRHLIKQGIEMVLVAPEDEYTKMLESYDGLTFHSLNSLSRKSLNPFRDLFLLIELAKIYFREKPDLVIHFTIKPNIFGSIAARLNSIPCISVVTGLGYTFLDGMFLNQVVKFLYSFAFRFCHCVVFENQDDKKLMLELGIVKPSQAQVVNGCGVDMQHFATSEASVADSGTFVFSFIGRLLYDKGIEEFVEAAEIARKSCPEAMFWIVGDIDTGNPSSITPATLNRWLKQKPIVYHGSTAEIRPFLAKSNCVVLPSYREGLPKVLLEAMSMARPVISTDVPGCRQAIENGENGYLVPVRSPEALATAMIKMFSQSQSDRREMGRKGLEKVQKKFRDEIVIGQYIHLIGKEMGDISLSKPVILEPATV